MLLLKILGLLLTPGFGKSFRYDIIRAVIVIIKDFPGMDLGLDDSVCVLADYVISLPDLLVGVDQYSYSTGDIVFQEFGCMIIFPDQNFSSREVFYFDWYSGTILTGQCA